VFPFFSPPLQAPLLKKLRVKYCYNIIISQKNMIALHIMDTVKAYYDSIRKEEEQKQKEAKEKTQCERLKSKALE